MRRDLVGQGNDAIDGHGRQGRDARGPGLVAGEPLDSLMHEALLPAPDHGFTLADGAHDLSGALAVGGQNNDPRSPHVLLRLLRSRMIDCKRTRSPCVMVMEIPLRITNHRTKPNFQKLPFGLFR